MYLFGEALRDLNLIKSFKPQRKGRFFIKEVFMEFKVKVQQERYMAKNKVNNNGNLGYI